jgi:hypothetical protein
MGTGLVHAIVYCHTANKKEFIRKMRWSSQLKFSGGIFPQSRGIDVKLTDTYFLTEYSLSLANLCCFQQGDLSSISKNPNLSLNRCFFLIGRQLANWVP